MSRPQTPLLMTRFSHTLIVQAIWGLERRRVGACSVFYPPQPVQHQAPQDHRTELRGGRDECPSLWALQGIGRCRLARNLLASLRCSGGVRQLRRSGHRQQLRRRESDPPYSPAIVGVAACRDGEGHPRMYSSGDVRSLEARGGVGPITRVWSGVIVSPPSHAPTSNSIGSPAQCPPIFVYIACHILWTGKPEAE